MIQKRFITLYLEMKQKFRGKMEKKSASGGMEQAKKTETVYLI